MVAVITGAGLGVERGSSFVLGSRGTLGSSGFGRYGENVYVNAATGNLAIQRQDELLIGRGLDDDVSRSYNSLGTGLDDNGDNWQLTQSRRVTGLTGTLNTAGSTVTRYDWDGSNIVYTWDATKSAYVSKEGAGPYDTLTFASNVWTWTDGGSRQTETYDNLNNGRITAAKDADGNALTFTYTGTLLTRVTTANGERTDYSYTANNLTQVVTTRSDGTTETRVRYTYDASNRLSTVTTDLTPTDNSVADGKAVTTTYTYDGTSDRVASISQTGGASLAITYTLVGSDYRVATLTQAQASGTSSLTSFSYDTTNRITTVTDAQGNVTKMTYDASGNLTKLEQPAPVAGGATIVSTYTYDANGNLTASYDGNANRTIYRYDANGNCTFRQDLSGATTAWTYDANNNLVAETHFLVPDPDAGGTGLPSQPVTTRYAYDAENHLVYAVTDEGRVTSYDYNAYGQLITQTAYTGALFDTSGLRSTDTGTGVTDTISKTTLDAWRTGLADSTAAQVTETYYDGRGNISTVARYDSLNVNRVRYADFPSGAAGWKVGTDANHITSGALTTGTTSGKAWTQVGFTATAAGQTTSIATDDSHFVPLTSLERLSVQAGIQATGAVGTVQLVVHWIDGTGAELSQTVVGSLAGAQSFGTLISGFVNVPSGAAKARLELIATSAGAGAGSVTLTQPMIARASLLQTAIPKFNARTTNNDDMTSTSIDGMGTYDRTYYVYDQAGNLLSARDSRTTNTQTYIYDGFDRVIGATDLAGATTSIVFTDTSNTSVVTAKDGSTTTSVYDLAGELISTSLAGSGVSAITTTNAYDNLGRLRMVTNALGQKSYFLYDNDGRKVADITADGALTETVYDAGGRIAHTVQYATKLSSTQIASLVDSSGKPAAVTLASLRPAANAADSWAWNIYDHADRLIETINSIGAATVYTYDGASRLLQTTAYATALSPTALANFKAAQPTTLQLPTGDAAHDRPTRYFYGNDGELVGTLDGDGALTQTVYDAAGQKIRTIAYATFTTASLRVSGTFAQLLASVGSNAADRQTDYVYDGVGQLRYTIEENSSGALGTGSTTSRLTEFAYDISGNLLHTLVYGASIAAPASNGTYSLAYVVGQISVLGLASNAANRMSHLVYDNANRLAFSIDPAGGVTQFVYDAAGRVIKTIAFAQTWTGTNDPALANWVSWAAGTITNTGNRISRTFYDAVSRPVYQVDAEGYVTESQYDALGRVVKTIRYPSAYTVDDTTTTASLKAAIGTVPATAVTVTSVYDTAGRLTDVTDGVGAVTHYAYDALDRVTDITVAYGTADASTTHTDYDQAGHAITIITAAGSPEAITVFYRYDALGNLQFKSDTAYENTNNYRGTFYVYDNLGQVLREVHVGVASMEASGVDSAWYFATYPDAASSGLDAQTHYDTIGWKKGYNPNPDFNTNAYLAGRPDVAAANMDPLVHYLNWGWAEGSQPSATVSTYQYFLKHSTATDVTKFTYDAFGNQATVTDPRGSVTTNYYDQLDRLVLTVDPMGYATATGYSLGGAVTSVTHYATAVSGTPSATAPPAITANASEDATTSFTLDKLDRVLKVTDAMGYYEQYTLDAFGDRTSVRNKLTGTTTNVFDHRGLLTSETLPQNSVNSAGTVVATSVTNTYAYDARGNRIQMVEASGLAEARTTTYAYDKMDRLVSKTGTAFATLNADRTNTTASTPVETYKYDLRGNLIEQKDAAGARTLSYYDDNDRRVAQISALGTLSTWTYDDNGNALTATVYGDVVALPANAGGTPPAPVNAANNHQTAYSYDKDNRLIGTRVVGMTVGERANGVYGKGTQDIVTSTRYDAAGNVIQQVDARGNATYSFYDKAGRKIAEVDQENYLTTYDLDADGNVTTETRYANRLTAVVSTASDPAALKTNAGSNAADRITQFTYDKNGRRLTETRLNVAASTVSATGVLTTATTNAKITYAYNGLGLVTRKTQANGDYTDYSYDLMGRTTEIAKSAYVDSSGASVRPTTDMQYDGLDQLIRQLVRGTDGTTEADDHITTYAYDKAGHVTAMTDASGFVTSSFYDIAGHLAKQQYTRQKSDGSSVTEADFYGYDLLGHQISQQKGTFAGGTSWTLSETTDMRYDAYGQMTGRGVNAAGATSKVYQEFADYDGMGRVWRTNFNDGVTKAYVYDANGNATLLLQSTGSADLHSLTLDQMVAAGSGVTETQSVFDKRNQLTETVQPSIENAAQQDGAINAFDTVNAGSNFTGGAVTVGSTRTTSGSGAGNVSGTPGSLAASKGGNFHVEYASHQTPYSTIYTWSISASNIPQFGGGTTYLYFVPTNGTEHLITTTTSNYINFSANQSAPSGGYYELRQDGPTGSGQIKIQSNIATFGDTALVSSLQIQAQNPNTSRLMLFVRPQGSTGPYQSIGTSQLLNSAGAAVTGWFTINPNAAPFNGLPANTGWDIKYYAMDGSGNTLNSQTATLSVDGSGNPSFSNVTAQPIGGAGKDILTREGSTDYLIASEQPSGTQSIRIRYRAAGSSNGWSTAWLSSSGYGQTGLWALNVTGWGGPYEYWLEDFSGAGGSGSLLAKSTGTFTVGGQPSALTGYVDLPETVHIFNQPAATAMKLWYKPAGSSTWTQAANPVWNSGTSSWDWDANGITPDKLSNYGYDFRYETYNGSVLVNQAHGTVQLGFNPVGTSSTADQLPSTVVFAPSQSNAATLILNYRSAGSTGAYSTVTLTKDGSGKFNWNADALRPGSGSTTLEYFYDLRDSSGNAIAPIGGEDHATGYVTINADRSTDTRTLQWVLVGSPDPAATIDRKQAYNAFGDIVSETDGRGYTTTMAYNVMGDLITKQGPQVDSTDEHGVVTRINPTEHYYYDVAGRLVGTDDANGNRNTLALLAGTGEGDGDAITLKEFHADSGVVSYGIDVFGDTRTVKDALGAVTTDSYDKMDRLVQVTHPTRVGGNSNGVALTDYYAYDGLGERITHTQSYARTGVQATYAAEIYRLYDAAFNRAADPSGFNTYMTAMTNGTTLAQLGQIFYSGSEYQARGVNAMTNLQFAQFLYTSVLRRNAEPGAAEAMASQLDSGNLTRGQALINCSESPEHIAIVANMPDRLPPPVTQTETTDYDAKGRVVGTKDFAGNATTYSYTFYDGSAIYDSGLGAFGGWQVATTASGRTSYQNLDLFGRLVWSRDYGSHDTGYAFDKAGHVVLQTNTVGQNISYAYYGNGYIRSIIDHSLNLISTFEYDKEGNRTLESYSGMGSNPIYYQVAAVTYDELNRVKTFTDAKATISYQYDAVGNRRRVLSTYHDGINGDQQTQDYWYKYDGMNRFVLTMGTLSGSGSTATIVTGSTGVQVGYDLDGQRKFAINGSDGSREDYTYTADGYLEDTKINNVLASRRVNDAMGRVTTYTEYLSNGSTVNFSQASTYDGDNRVTDQVVTQRQSDGSNTVTNVHNDYRADAGGGVYTGTDQGVITHSRQQQQGSSVVQDTAYSYVWWDEAKQTGIQVKGTDPGNPNAYQWAPGASQFSYDVNGHLKTAVLTGGTSATITYTNDAYGQVLEREQKSGSTMGPRQLYYYLDGNRIGDVGNDGPSRVDYATALAQRDNPVQPGAFRNGKPVSSADFDENYEPIGPGYPGMAASTYTVRGGDTLASIAQALWGDSSLWYMIADANGLTGSDALIAGQTLSIPNKVTNVHNQSGVYRVYNPGEAIGDAMPTLPAEPAPPVHKHGGCGIIGQIIMVAIAVAVTIALAPTVIGEPAAIGLDGSLINATGLTAAFGGTFASVGTAAAVGAGIVGGAAVGAAASVASQAFGVVTGIQDHFSFKGVALAAISGGIGGGIGGAGILRGASGITGIGQDVARGALASGLSQGVALASGLQSQFDWAGVAAAGVSAGVLGALPNVGGNGADHYLVEGLSGSAAAVASAAARSLLTGTDFGDNILRALPDVVGQTIGNLAATEIASIGAPTRAANASVDRLGQSLFGDQGVPDDQKQLFADARDAIRNAVVNSDDADARAGANASVSAILDANSDNPAVIDFQQSINNNGNFSAAQSGDITVTGHRGYWAGSTIDGAGIWVGENVEDIQNAAGQFISDHPGVGVALSVANVGLTIAGGPERFVGGLLLDHFKSDISGYLSDKLGANDWSTEKAAAGGVGFVTAGGLALKGTSIIKMGIIGGFRGAFSGNLVDEAHIAELTANGVKFTRNALVATGRDAGGKVLFLEKGNTSSGLQHIIGAHGDDFARAGISEADVPGVIMKAATQGQIVGYQGRGTGRPIYEIDLGGRVQRIAITTGSNGYIVGANPAGGVP